MFLFSVYVSIKKIAEDHFCGISSGSITTTQAFHTSTRKYIYLNIDIFADMYANNSYTYEEIDKFYIYQNEFIDM